MALTLICPDTPTRHWLTALKSVARDLDSIIPLLADAVANQRTWLKDFDGDEITISSDLYEVLLAYQHYRRPSA